MRLRTDIKRPTGRPLQVCIVARYSKEEQNKHSIDAQVLLCKKHLREWGFNEGEVDIDVIADAEISGELVDRPGIFKLRVKIADRACNLIIAEDSSRVYRNPSACDDLVGTAVDNGIRAIFPGDDIDTAEENWQSDLFEAQSHHTRTNSFTRKRIKRAQEERWNSGAAMGLLKPGYVRRPSTPATAKDPAEGPFFDEIDPRWAPIIQQAFERGGQGEALWSVASWLTEVGLPKAATSRSSIWSEKNVIELIRRTVYRGVEEYGATLTKKHHGSGKGKQHRQECADVWTRAMEHHRIVTDHQWYQANAAIDARITRPPPPHGLEHPLAGIPRDSRSPMANIFCCGCCGDDSKMYAEGRREGGYRCSRAKKGACWNRATALRQLTHQKIGEAVAAELLAGSDCTDVLCRHIQSCLASDEPRQLRLAELSKKISELTQKRDRLADLLEEGKGDSAVLLQRLQGREQELAVAKAEFAQLSQQKSEQRKLPSREEIGERIRQVGRQLLEFAPEVAEILRRLLVGPILAIPYQQFGGNNVVLRAEFKINVLGILAADLASLLEGAGVKTSIPTEVRTLVVDLFPPSIVPQYAITAWGLRKNGVKPKEIERLLGISKRQTTQAVKLGRELEEAKLQDPYIRLTERPATASRWRSKRPTPLDDDQAAEDAA